MRVHILFRSSYGIQFILELGHSTDQSKVVGVKRTLLVQCLLFECTLSGRSYINKNLFHLCSFLSKNEKESIRVSSGIYSS